MERELLHHSLGQGERAAPGRGTQAGVWMCWLCEGPIPAVGQKCPKELIPREDFPGKVTLCKSDYLVLYYCFSLFNFLWFSWVFSKVLFKGSSLDPAKGMALKEDPGSPLGPRWERRAVPNRIHLGAEGGLSEGVQRR